MIQEMQSVYSKVQACVFTWFPNKSVCIYDYKHASKQIPWIDEFQNEKDIQLSLVNIMPFRYRAALLHWLFADVGSSLGHKNDMFCLPGVVFFSQIFLCRLTLYTNRLKCIK